MIPLIRKSCPLIVMVCICAIGCDSGGTKVTGKVTFDGNPVDSGSIIFSPTEANKGPSISGAITKGEYSLKAPNGSYKVMITAEKMMPSTSTNKSAPEEMRNYLPAKYASGKSELTAQVDGKPINFELKSDPPKK